MVEEPEVDHPATPVSTTEPDATTEEHASVPVSKSEPDATTEEHTSYPVTPDDADAPPVQHAWKVSLLLFGPLAEEFGSRRLDLAVLEGSRVIDVIERFQLGDRLEAGLTVALDGEIGPAERTLHDGAEIALLPPVSGG